MSKTDEAQQEFTLSPESRQQIDDLIARYPTLDSALMPALWVIQDAHGYVPPPAVDFLVATLGVTPARVYELLTF